MAPWQNRHEHAPASALWFFILALTGASGQVVYSWMLGNWVYFVLNVFLIGTDAFGLAVVAHRRFVTRDQPQPSAVNNGGATINASNEAAPITPIIKDWETRPTFRYDRQFPTEWD